MQVEEFLERSAARWPAKTALVCGPRRLTYAELDRQANLLAHELLAAGVQRGDRVAIYADNSPEVVISVFAVLKAGGVFLVVNPSTKSDKLGYILNHCSARAVVCDSARYKRVSEVLPSLPTVQTIWVSGPGDHVPARSLAAVLENSAEMPRPRQQNIDMDLAALIYTSGSTGQPKGVTLTHLNIVSAATSINTYLGNSEADTLINVLPLAFDYGLYQVLLSFQVGATLVLEKSFTYPHAVLETIMREGVTGLPLVPTMGAILLQMDLSRYALPQLRYITNTAAALPVAHIEKLRGVFPHVTLFSMYGLTECKRVSYLPPEELDRRPGSVGRGMPNEEVYIVDDDGNRVGPNVIGELVVRGSNVMKGYWNDPVETAKRLKAGPNPWELVLYTGDLFRADGEGFLYFVGRKDDIIKSRGEKVSPREVEEVLYKLSGIAEAVVVGVPDEVLGAAIKAVVRLADGAQLGTDEIRRHCARNLEDFMVPKYIEMATALAKTANGKIDRREVAYA